MPVNAHLLVRLGTQRLAFHLLGLEPLTDRMLHHQLLHSIESAAKHIPDDKVSEFPDTSNQFSCPFYLTLSLGKTLLVQIEIVDIGNDAVPVPHVGGLVPPFAQPALLLGCPSFQPRLESVGEARVQELVDERLGVSEFFWRQMGLNRLQVFVESRRETRYGKPWNAGLRCVQRLIARCAIRPRSGTAERSCSGRHLVVL